MSTGVEAEVEGEEEVAWGEEVECESASSSELL